MSRNKLKTPPPRKGYTLTEVVIVMLVIAVVAGVCIKAAKTKLDKIISYTYNIAYSTLNATTKEMLNDFKADEDYLAIKTLK